MLFTVKRDVMQSLGLALVLAVVAVGAQQALGLDWSLEATTPVLLAIGGGLLAIILLDALVHGVLLLGAGDDYSQTFRALVDYYRGQSPPTMLAGGLLAGAEELLFRGVVLLGLVKVASAPAWLAVVVAALLFGAAHYVPTRRVRPFAIWAVLEGLVLGGLLVATVSLPVPVVVHVLHDVIGFSLFAWLRRKRA